MALDLWGMVEGLTGMKRDKIADGLKAKVKETFRAYICTCGHIAGLHGEGEKRAPGFEASDLLIGNHRGRCSGVTNGEKCKCATFVSLAAKDGGVG